MSKNLRNVLVIVVTAVVILAGLWLVKGPWRQPGSAGTAPSGVTSVDVNVPAGQAAPAVGRPAADFSATTITGDSISLSGWRGQPVWLLFGATWCTDCRVEAPDIQAVSQAFAGRVQVVAVYVGEDQATVQDYANRLGLTYHQIADVADTIAGSYAVMGIPAHFFIDADGVIQTIRVGAITRQDAIDQLTALLGG